jgi:uncharacterized damage-inducible protein DinB
MALAETLIAEMEQEAGATRAALARVPDDKLTWKPHEKSMSMGQLAQHIATLPGGVAQMGTLDSKAMESFTPTPPPESAAAIRAAFESGLAEAKRIVGAMSDADLMKNWSLTRGGVPMLTLPRIGLFRTIMMNHLYHHRGQLTVYLRLLNIPVPSIYGPSADENPFG